MCGLEGVGWCDKNKVLGGKSAALIITLEYEWYVSAKYCSCLFFFKGYLFVFLFVFWRLTTLTISILSFRSALYNSGINLD